jgi:hypothetical protein
VIVGNKVDIGDSGRSSIVGIAVTESRGRNGAASDHGNSADNRGRVTVPPVVIVVIGLTIVIVVTVLTVVVVVTVVTIVLNKW